MRSLWLGGLLVLAGSLAFGQLESDTLTITASRQALVQPDQVAFRISVNSGVSTALDQVVAALQGAGITTATFSSLSSLSSASAHWFNGPVLNWSFTLRVPLARMKATTALLAAAQQRISDQNNGLSISFSLEDAQVSPELESQQCSIPDLMSDAQAQAQKLASAAGFGVGPVLALSSGTSGGGFRQAFVFRFLDLSPDVSGFVPIISFGVSSSTTITAVSNCSMVVKFKLLRFQ
jgi:uncharacterized protein YggE